MGCIDSNQCEPRHRRRVRARQPCSERSSSRSANHRQRRARLSGRLATNTDDPQPAAHTSRLASTHAAQSAPAVSRRTRRKLGAIWPSGLPQPMASTESITLPGPINQRRARQQILRHRSTYAAQRATSAVGKHCASRSYAAFGSPRGNGHRDPELYRSSLSATIRASVNLDLPRYDTGNPESPDSEIAKHASLNIGSHQRC